MSDVRWTVTDRGFKHYAPFTVDGHDVQVYESSAAESPHLWIKTDGETKHVALEDAQAIHDSLDGGLLKATLAVAIERHYQKPGPDPDDWKAGDPCAMCGSRDTGENGILGAFCRTCGAADSDV